MWLNFTKVCVCIAAGVMLASCSSSRVRPADPESDQLASVPDSVQREYAEAVAKIAADNDAAAIRQLEEFISENPQYPGAYINLAILYDRQNQIEQALWLLNRAIEIEPDSVSALNRLGLIMRREGKFTEAEAAWLRATEVDPAYSNAWYNLGILYDIYLQDLPAAIDHYRRYQELTAGADDPLAARWIEDLERRVGEPARAAEARGLR